MRASILLGALALASVACSSPSVPPDVLDAASDAAASTDAPVDRANPPGTLTYRPEGCDYDVSTAPGTINNRMGDETTFGAAPEPRNVHVNWASDPATSAAILWATDAETLATVVEYGTSMDALDRRAIGHRSTAGGARNQTHVHEVHLCGLQPGTTYYYRVGGPGHFSPVYHFTTAPPRGMKSYDVNFVVVGDSRGPTNFPGNWQSIEERISSVTGANQPDFQIFTGDAVLLGTVQADWDLWFGAAVNNFANMPWVLVHGNHEGLTVNYLAQFAQPQAHGELYFSFDYGPIHMVVMNDTPPVDVGYEAVTGAYAEWLDADLAAVDRARTPWVIVTHHKGPYTTSTHADDMDVATVRAAWTPIYDRHHVNLVINGHDHSFHVTHPLRAGAVTSPDQGTVYMISGGAGAPLYSVTPGALFQHVESTMNFVLVHATERVLEVKPYRADGTPISEGSVTLRVP